MGRQTSDKGKVHRKKKKKTDKCLFCPYTYLRTVKTDIFLFFPLYVTRCVSLTVSSQVFFLNVSLKLPKKTTFTLSSGQDIIPWSKSSTVKDTCLFKVCWEKKKKNTNISIFATTPTYLKQTFVCFFSSFFSMNLF